MPERPEQAPRTGTSPPSSSSVGTLPRPNGASAASKSTSLMGTRPLAPLLFRMAIPATAAMAANGIYNVVDAIFIGQGVGADAIGGLSVVFPVQMILLALALATGQGASSIISRSLGANKPETAQSALAHALLLSFLTGSLILLLGQLFSEPLLQALGAIGLIRTHARDYLKIILISAPFFCLSVATNNMARAEGKARTSMIIILTGSLTNIILDPIFIFVLELGVRGAAWATVISQILACLYIVYCYTARTMSIIPHRRHWKLQLPMLRRIGTLGLPALSRQGGLSIVILLINQMLGTHGGPLYISAYGIVHRILIFLFMPVLGIIQAYMPIAGYNYGARQYPRVISVLKLACLSSLVYSMLTTLIVLVFPIPIVSIFTRQPSLVTTARSVIYYMLPLFPSIGIQLIGSAHFLVIGKACPSIFLNLIRQFILLPLFILILSPLLGTSGTLLSIPLSDALSLAVTSLFLFRAIRTLRHADTLQ